VTGTYGKDIIRIRLMVNGKIIKPGFLDGNGHYKVPGARGWFTAKDDVEVVGYTQEGKEIHVKVPILTKKI
ncbi:immunoglobulin-like domain-containing protein, partial [Enterococcus faecalis]